LPVLFSTALSDYASSYSKLATSVACRLAYTGNLSHQSDCDSSSQFALKFLSCPK